MSKKTIVVCDFCDDDEPGTEMLVLKLNGYGSRIDVCKDHGQELRNTVLPIMKVGQQTGNKPVDMASIDPEQAKAIRVWADKNDVPYNPRGRLRQSTIDAYNEAH